MKYMFFILLLLCIFSCSQESSIQENIWGNNILPIVFVHGSLASGDTYAKQYQRFTSNGYRPDLLHVFDWNTVNQANTVNKLDEFIEKLRALSPNGKVILVGHSAGGGVCYNYCNDNNRAQKIEKYIHLGSNRQSNPAGLQGQIPTLNIWSIDDRVVSGDSIKNCINIKLSGYDHYQLATGAEAFKEMYKFITGTEPVTSEVVEESEIFLGGRVVSLGENNIVNNTVVSIFSLDPATGFRKQQKPDSILIPDANGWWGPMRGNQQTYYEFEVKKPGDSSFRIVHYYREPFKRSNPWIYLRTFPSPLSTVGLLLSALPQDDGQAVVAVFSSNQAIIDTRDQLKVNNLILSKPDLTAASQTTIALFLYDDMDCLTSLTPKSLFSFLPFLKAADFYFGTKMPQTIELEFNNHLLHVVNWKSKSEGVSIPVFD